MKTVRSTRSMMRKYDHKMLVKMVEGSGLKSVAIINQFQLPLCSLECGVYRLLYYSIRCKTSNSFKDIGHLVWWSYKDIVVENYLARRFVQKTEINMSKNRYFSWSSVQIWQFISETMSGEWLHVYRNTIQHDRNLKDFETWFHPRLKQLDC